MMAMADCCVWAYLNSGELRLIQVKGLAEPSGTILLTPNERRVAEDRLLLTLRGHELRNQADASRADQGPDTVFVEGSQ